MDSFGQIADDARGHQPLYSWSRLQQGLSAMIGKRPIPAEEAFREVEKAGETGFAKENSDLAKFFVSTAAKLLEPGPIAANSVTDQDSYHAFALLAFAIKNFNQGDVTDAAALLQRFMEANPSGDFSWIADLKPAAKRYLRDCEAYIDWKNEAAKANDPAAVASSLARLQGLKKRLRGHTAILNDLAADETRLRQMRATTEQPEQPQVTEPTQETVQEFAQKKQQWLGEWKNKLIADLNRARYTGNISATGASYTGIIGATAQKLKMRTPYGSLDLPWENLSPQTLLAVSVSFAKPGAPDAADRQWLCAVYASHTGQVDEARRLADEAAKAKPEYQGQISLLVK
jgi:hypothetical protein